MEHIGFRRVLVQRECKGVLVAEWKSIQINNTMYLGKIENGEMLLVECENGKELSGRKRNESTLRSQGYKNACLVEKPSEDAVESWQEFNDCFVQVWQEHPVEEVEQ